MAKHSIPIENHGVSEDFPILWGVAVKVDDNEKRGFMNLPVENEIAQALHEVWLARANKKEKTRA